MILCLLLGDPAEAAPPRAEPVGEPVADWLRQRTAFGVGTKDASLSMAGLWGFDLVLWDRRNARRSGLEGGDADFRIDGRLRDFRWRAAVDLLGEDTRTRLTEAWAGWMPEEGANLRAGLQRLSLGTEGATDVEVLPLPGRGYAAVLDGRTDLALRVDAEAAGGLLWGEAAAFAGHGFLEDGTAVGSPGAQVRLAVRPVREGALSGLFAGVGAARLADQDDPLVLQTPLGSTTFRTVDLDARSGTRLHLEAGAAAGPVAGGFEAARGIAADAALPGGPREDLDELTAWSASLAWRITGEPWEWRRGAWRGAAPCGRSGQWEVALRYANADVDRDLFRRGFTTYDPSSQETRTFSAMLGWRPAAGLRVAVGWVKTIADDALTVFGGPGPTAVARSGGDGRDSSFLLRVEVSF